MNQNEENLNQEVLEQPNPNIENLNQVNNQEVLEQPNPDINNLQIDNISDPIVNVNEVVLNELQNQNFNINNNNFITNNNDNEAQEDFQINPVHNHSRARNTHQILNTIPKKKKSDEEFCLSYLDEEIDVSLFETNPNDSFDLSNASLNYIPNKFKFN